MGGGGGSESALSSSHSGQAAQAGPGTAVWEGDRAVLTCHSVSPGGTSPAQSLFHQQWSGKAQTPGRKQKAGAEGEAQPQNRQTMCHLHYLQQSLARQGQSSPWQLGARMQHRLTPAPPGLAGHSCPHSGIYISAHPAKCNSCSGTFRIPPIQKRIWNSSNVTSRVQSVTGNGRARSQPFPGSSTPLPPFRVTELPSSHCLTPGQLPPAQLPQQALESPASLFW